MPNVNITNIGKNPPETYSVQVDYKNKDGYHIFTSDAVPGLFIASQDGGKALCQLCPAIERLVKHNLGIKCTAEISCILKLLPGGKIDMPDTPQMENKVVILRAA